MLFERDLYRKTVPAFPDHARAIGGLIHEGGPPMPDIHESGLV